MNHKGFIKSIEVVLGIAASIILAIILTSILLDILVLLPFNIAGDPVGPTPGGVIASLFYLFLVLIIALLIILRTKYRAFGYSLGISALFMSFLVYVLTSSTLWL